MRNNIRFKNYILPIAYCQLPIIIFSFFISQAAVAQKNLRDTVIVDVVKSFQPTISDAFKINENPIINDSTKKIPQINYSILSSKMNTPFDIEPIKPAKMIGEPLTKLYKYLLKGGLGNYTTPYGEFFFNNTRSKDYSYGAHLKHISSLATLKNWGFMGYSENDVNLYGKKFLNKQTLTGDIDYNRNVVHGYGYDPILNKEFKKELTKQRFSYIGSSIGLMSHYADSSRINHNLNLSYYNLMDSYKARENNVKVNGVFKGFFGKEQIILTTGIDYYHHKNVLDSADNTIIHLSPEIITGGAKWRASFGGRAFIDIYNTNKLYLYPNVYGQYNAVESIIIPYAGIDGKLKKNSFKSLSDVNPFIISTALLQNSNNSINLFAGVRGNISSDVSFNTKVTYSRMNSMAFFVSNNSTLIDKFAVIYDDVNLVNLHGEIAFQQLEKLRISAKADYNKYTMTHELHPWYSPKFSMTLSGNYNIKNKIIARADVFIMGKQFAPTYNTTSIGGISTSILNGGTLLKGIADINLGVEYLYTKRLSAFLNLNNIGAFRYYRWNNYPTQRFNLLGGVAYAF